MRTSLVRALTAICFVWLTWPVFGQSAQSQASNGTMGTLPAAAQVPQLPYTAEYRITHVRTLADGSTVTHESTEVKAVDSQGRQMIATTMMQPGSGQPQYTDVHVSDPTAHAQSNWTSRGKRATVEVAPTHVPSGGGAGTALGLVLSASSPCPATSAVDSPPVASPNPSLRRQQPVREDLGIETIQGVEAHGRRISTTMPVGAIGNSEALTTTTETWSAVTPGLGSLIVRQIIDNPLNGKQTRELVSLTQSEPDPSVFQPPEGYEVVKQEMHFCPQGEPAAQPQQEH